jgi:Leucine-rich repeat (LRR) protein
MFEIVSKLSLMTVALHAVARCGLLQLPQLPAALTELKCQSCDKLAGLPELSHTGLTYLNIAACKQLTGIPDLPATLDNLQAWSLPRVTRLPALSGREYVAIDIDGSGLTELPDPLPRIDALICSNTRIRRLPTIAGCADLRLDGCRQLRQLPKQLPNDLVNLNLEGCSALQQLPAKLPSRLRTLNVSECTALQQLPAQVPCSLVYLNCEGCSSLQQLPNLAGSGLQQLWIKGCVQLQGVNMAGCGKLVVHFN